MFHIFLRTCLLSVCLIDCLVFGLKLPLHIVKRAKKENETLAENIRVKFSLTGQKYVDGVFHEHREH